MPIDAFVRPLLSLDIFRGLKPLQLTEIARRAYRITYKAGDVITRENAPGDAAILIISGDAVRLDTSDLSDLGEPLPLGSLIAEMAMLTDMLHASTIIATSQVRALRIARDDLVEQMMEDRALADHFMRRISGRLSNVLDELRQIDGQLASGMPLSGRRMSVEGPTGQSLRPDFVH
ncbi:MAG: cyclic nucleotide-binding domain-containing protein [Hyphomicrobium sp.]|nr:cyclic nucleotide-binding domain-containing protein [Hyphomicrobium sp.]